MDIDGLANDLEWVSIELSRVLPTLGSPDLLEIDRTLGYCSYLLRSWRVQPVTSDLVETMALLRRRMFTALDSDVAYNGEKAAWSSDLDALVGLTHLRHKQVTQLGKTSENIGEPLGAHETSSRVRTHSDDPQTAERPKEEFLLQFERMRQQKSAWWDKEWNKMETPSQTTPAEGEHNILVRSVILTDSTIQPPGRRILLQHGMTVEMFIHVYLIINHCRVLSIRSGLFTKNQSVPQVVQRIMSTLDTEEYEVASTVGKVVGEHTYFMLLPAEALKYCELGDWDVKERKERS